MKGNTSLPHRKPINLITGFFAEHQRPKALDCGSLLPLWHRAALLPGFDVACASDEL
jgi:hypothetical protein